MKVKIKTCGIKTYLDARLCIEAGADFLGFNFVSISQRFIDADRAKEIIRRLPKEVKTVGVFQNKKQKIVQSLSTKLKLDFIQLHGEETPEYCRDLCKDFQVIKTLKLLADFNVQDVFEEMKKYLHCLILLDRRIQGKGRMLNLSKVNYLTGVRRIFLGGGLTPENVGEAVYKTKPYGVDVASGVETDGRKDKAKISKFIMKAKYG